MHCCQPLHLLLGVRHTVRASIGVYNTEEDVDLLFERIKEGVKFFMGEEME